ncbi:MAG: glycosyltransferase [Duncaniella sp.]|nr:glycosyltransferase [Muribaculum sp.]MCM1254623.1 glycosyltransferase [Duncaniella sp.]
MKIAMILPSLAQTGPGFVVKDLCTEFIKLGHTCKVFFFDDVARILLMPCEVENIKFCTPFDFDSWDIIHSHMFRPDLYLSWHSRKIKRAKTVSTLHNPITLQELHKSYSLIKSLAASILWSRALYTSNRIITLNSITLNEQKTYIRDKSCVIFNGRNINIANANSLIVENPEIGNLKAQYKIIGTICSLTKRKAVDQIIKALKFLPNYAFFCLGEGKELDNLITLAKSLGVENRCYFIGFKENATDYISLFDIFALTSKSEGFPLALIEAAAYGIPTVLSDIPILRSIISDKEVCFYELENITDLIHAINKASQESEHLSKNIHEFYKKELTADEMAAKYLALYYKILI